ncbi:hypothetical protein HPP92_006288 [Vanilla planifolia]|uniref:Uncharacterized protein n=1 Tax=Vanilla planifolia TaxID=51239 RepID=A0A835VDQ3_VANPL|nr:hypothetical protein HPP92_006563 [Vanilla planifolia]KAG0495294.1 hypothetical protein HPP92_006288 [Vanilla planifolia]
MPTVVESARIETRSGARRAKIIAWLLPLRFVSINMKTGRLHEGGDRINEERASDASRSIWVISRFIAALPSSRGVGPPRHYRVCTRNGRRLIMEKLIRLKCRQGRRLALLKEMGGAPIRCGVMEVKIPITVLPKSLRHGDHLPLPRRGLCKVRGMAENRRL